MIYAVYSIMLIMSGRMVRAVSSFEHVLYPDAVDIAVLLGEEEGTETFDGVVLEASTELVSVHHEEGAKALFFVFVEFSFVVFPIVGVGEVEVIVIGVFAGVVGVFVVEYAKTVEGVAFPATGVAELSVWVVEDAVAVELVVGVELALVACAVVEEVFAVGLVVEDVGGEGVGEGGLAHCG
jgi:hypothetical protein